MGNSGAVQIFLLMNAIFDIMMGPAEKLGDMFSADEFIQPLKMKLKQKSHIHAFILLGRWLYEWNVIYYTADLSESGPA